MLASERHKFILEQLRLYGRIRAKEIAVELSVSEITLRRDLNELHDAGKLSRVHGGAVRRGEEQPGAASQTLIGILVPGSVYYFPEVIKGMEMVAERLSVRLVLGVSGSDMESEAGHVKRMLDLGVAGMLITTVAGDHRGAELGAWLNEIPVPVVLLERSFGFPHIKKELDHVRSDHVHGAMLAIQHLHDLGHRRIAVALAETPTAFWLEQGATKAMQNFGIEQLRPAFRFPRTEGRAIQVSLEEFYEQCIVDGVTGVFIHNDTPASALVNMALGKGLRIPEDLSVVAYDDVAAKLAAVPLTAVSPPKHSVGALALEQLVRRLGIPADRQETVAHLSLLPRINVRDSTGPAPR